MSGKFTNIVTRKPLLGFLGLSRTFLLRLSFSCEPTGFIAALSLDSHVRIYCGFIAPKERACVYR
jgi:hypothetical protein